MLIISVWNSSHATLQIQNIQEPNLISNFFKLAFINSWKKLWDTPSVVRWPDICRIPAHQTAKIVALLLNSEGTKGDITGEKRGKVNLYLKICTCLAKMCSHILNNVDDPKNFKPGYFKLYQFLSAVLLTSRMPKKITWGSC